MNVVDNFLENMRVKQNRPPTGTMYLKIKVAFILVPLLLREVQIGKNIFCPYLLYFWSPTLLFLMLWSFPTEKSLQKILGG